jgi:hypothetical protein
MKSLAFTPLRTSVNYTSVRDTHSPRRFFRALRSGFLSSYGVDSSRRRFLPSREGDERGSGRGYPGGSNGHAFVGPNGFYPRRSPISFRLQYGTYFKVDTVPTWCRPVSLMSLPCRSCVAHVAPLSSRVSLLCRLVSSRVVPCRPVSRVAPLCRPVSLPHRSRAVPCRRY